MFAFALEFEEGEQIHGTNISPGEFPMLFEPLNALAQCVSIGSLSVHGMPALMTQVDQIFINQSCQHRGNETVKKARRQCESATNYSWDNMIHGCADPTDSAGLDSA